MSFSYYEKIGEKVTCIDDEIPFEIPDNWCWARGLSCFSEMKSMKPQNQFFSYIDIDSIDNKRHIVSKPKLMLSSEAPSRANRRLQNGSVIFSMVRPYLENIAYIDTALETCIASTGFYVCISNGSLYPRYMFYLMLSRYVIDGLNKFMKGDNSPSIKRGDIENWLYPVPPANEQKKIVDAIQRIQRKITYIEASLS